MPQNRAKFARLFTGAVNAMAAFEGKSSRAVAQELGEAISRSSGTIENYKGAKAAPSEDAQIRTLVTLCARRAHLNATLLRAMLESLDYADADRLIAEIFTDHAQVSQEFTNAPWYDNLEAPPYGRFIMRHEILTELIDGIRSHKTVALVSLGGMGKTSLAYQVASRCKEQRTSQIASSGRLPAALPDIDGVIWLSDRDQPGATTLASTLDSIARALDHHGITAYEPAQKRYAAERLLQARRTLLVVDNFESIADPQLMPWLLRLPLPTRVLITTRTRRAEFFDDHVRLIEMGGMSALEAGRLIGERMAQIGMPGALGPDDQQQIMAITGGSPLAIRQVLGYLKRTGQTLAAVAAGFAAVEGDLLADLFARDWPLFEASARGLLLAMTLFPGSVARETLGQVAGYAGAELDQAIAVLTERALLDMRQGADDGQPQARFSIHSLTRRFIAARQHDLAEQLAAAYERWLAWANVYAAGFGYQLRDIERLNALDTDQEALFAALGWAAANRRDAEAMRIACGLEFYYYVRGWWGRKSELHMYYLAAAQRSGDVLAQVGALTMHIQHLCRLDRPEEARSYLDQLDSLCAAHTLAGEPAFHVAHARALYALTLGDHRSAQDSWSRILDSAAEWALPDHMDIGTHHWLGVSHYRQGNRAEAQQHFERSLAHAGAAGYDRWIARNQLQLTRLDVERGELRAAQERLAMAREHTSPEDREQLAHFYLAQARLHKAMGRHIEAQADYYTARDLFTRMGLLHELRDDEADLVSLRLGA